MKTCIAAGDNDKE